MYVKKPISLTYKRAFDYGFNYSNPELTEKLKAIADIPIKITKKPEHSGNAFYNPSDNEILVSPEIKDNAFVISHELGHHELTKNPITNFIQSNLANPLNLILAASSSPLVAGTTALVTGSNIKPLTTTAILASTPFLQAVNEWLAWREGKKKLETLGIDQATLEAFEKEKLVGLNTYLKDSLGATAVSLFMSLIAIGIGKGIRQLILSGEK